MYFNEKNIYMIEKPPKKKSTKKINEYKLKNSIKLAQVKDQDIDYTKVLTQIVGKKI